MAKPLKIKKISPSDPLEQAAARILKTRLKEFYSHWPDLTATPAPKQLHNLRISGKRLRYSAESLREFYPDRLALMAALLKNGQDLLGEYQDCVTHRTMIEEDLKRLKRRKPESPDIPILEDVIAALAKRQSVLFNQFRDIWLGMSLTEFRDYLKSAVTRVNRQD